MWMDPGFKNTEHLLLSLREHMSTMHCSSRRNFQACTSWLSCGFNTQQLHCVVLAPGNWSFWEQSAGIAVPLPWPSWCFHATPCCWAPPVLQHSSALCRADVSSGHLRKSFYSSQLTPWQLCNIQLRLLKKRAITRGCNWQSWGACTGEGLIHASQSMNWA